MVCGKIKRAMASNLSFYGACASKLQLGGIGGLEYIEKQFATNLYYFF